MEFIDLEYKTLQAITYSEQGRIDLGKKFFKEAEDLDKDNPGIYFLQAEYSRYYANNKEILKLYKKAFSLDKTLKFYYGKFFDTLNKNPQKKELVKYVNLARKLGSTYFHFYVDYYYFFYVVNQPLSFKNGLKFLRKLLLQTTGSTFDYLYSVYVKNGGDVDTSTFEGKVVYFIKHYFRRTIFPIIIMIIAGLLGLLLSLAKVSPFNYNTHNNLYTVNTLPSEQINKLQNEMDQLQKRFDQYNLNITK